MLVPQKTKITKGLLSSNSNEWETPKEFFDNINKIYNFEVDLAASATNKKCQKFFTQEDDSLSKNWHLLGNNWNWCNPPYGEDIIKWVEKAWTQSANFGAKTVMLLPSRTDTQWFSKFVFDKAAEIYIIVGRLKFVDLNKKKQSGCPFPSLLAIYNGTVPRCSHFGLITNKGIII